jgi:uncharacterized membrane protein required for colicin V production
MNASFLIMLFGSFCVILTALAYKNSYVNSKMALKIVFIIIFAALKVIENIILKMMEETAAFSVDKGLGFVLGLLEGIVICSLVTYLINIQTIFNMDKMLNSSFFVPFFNKIFPFLESTSSAVMNKIKK